MTDIHAVPGPYISSEQATHLMAHGTPAQLQLITEAIKHIGGADRVVAIHEPEACDQPDTNGCFWLEVVVTGWVDAASVGAAYMAAVATHN